MNSATLPLEETDWRVLLKAIRQRNCVLLLGPGVSVDPANPQDDPLPVQLTQRLAYELHDAGKGDQLLTTGETTGDLAHVAQTYERAMRKRRTGLELAVEDILVAKKVYARSRRTSISMPSNASRSRGSRAVHGFCARRACLLQTAGGAAC